jgi:hypothetical protein
MTTAEKVKRHIDQAMENRDARVAILIAEQIRNAVNMIDVQPSAVIEAMIERGKHLQYLATHRSIDAACGTPLSNISNSVCARLGSGSANWRKP